MGIHEAGRFVTGSESDRGKSNFLLLFFAIALIGPFLLSAVLPPGAWFGSVLGLIIGFSLSQLSMIYVVDEWEKKNEIELEGYQVWVYDEQNRVKVIERGVMKKVD
jgi:hypothetical protein